MIRLLTLPGYARIYGVPLSEVTRRCNTGELPSAPHPLGRTRVVLDCPPADARRPYREPLKGQAIELITTPALAALLGIPETRITAHVRSDRRPAGSLGGAYLHFRPPV